MKASSAYPSAWLHVEDLGEDGRVLTIEGYSLEKFKEQGYKPVLSFRGMDQRLILNKTNNNTLIQFFGDETDSWIGKKILLFSEPVNFGGKVTDGLRIRAFKAKGNAAAVQQSEPELELNPNPEPYVPF